MSAIRENFGGISTDLYPNRLPSGTADIAVNVNIDKGELAKRDGFTEYEDAVASTSSVLNGCCAKFTNGTIYVVVKLADAKLYQRKIYPATAATSFTAITTNQTHSASDPGFFFMHADRLYYFDSGGGSKWNPAVNSGTAYKAGLPKPATSLTAAAIAGGEKDGRYHVYWAMRNSATMETGPVSGTQSATIQCRIDTNTGGIATSNWTTGGTPLRTSQTEYEWDQGVTYCTMGSTEYIERGSGVDCYSHRAYEDVIATKATAAEIGMNKADHVLDHRYAFTNAGGLPPAATIGCYTGSRAIYGGISGQANKIMFSIPGQPTSVPQIQTYQAGGDAKTFYPQPWLGEVTGCIDGLTTSMAYGGGVAAAFTATSAYALRTLSDGRIRPVMAHPSKGCAAVLGSCGSSQGVHAVGRGWWLLVTPGGVIDLAEDNFSGLLTTIPVAYENLTRTAWFSWRNETWAAVVKTGATVAQRIVVLTKPKVQGQMPRPVCYDLACLGTRATYTTAMTGNNNDLTFTAEVPGAPGNSVTIAYANTASGNGSETVSVSGSAITVAIKTGASTASNVLAAFRRCPDAMALATCALAGGNTGAGTIPAVLSAANLTGGTGDEGITAMWEVAYPGVDPTMYVGTTKGRILSYGASATTDNNVNFGARWRGYFGQERAGFSQKLGSIELHSGANVAGNLIAAVKVLPTAGQSITEHGKTLAKSSAVEKDITVWDHYAGRVIQLDLASDQAATTRWNVRDLVVKLERN